ncbi:MAG: DUF2141 domain-containing protein [Pseudomonadota bacterium]
MVKNSIFRRGVGLFIANMALCGVAMAQGESTAGDAQQIDLPRVKSVAGVPDGACHDAHEGPMLHLQVDGLKKRIGQMRIELYSDDPDLFLEGKGQIYRYFTAIPNRRDDIICLTVPEPGNYGLLVIHDMDNDGSPNFFSDGFGLSTNPQLQLRRPQLSEALFRVESGVTDMQIKVLYATGNAQTRSRGSRRR